MARAKAGKGGADAGASKSPGEDALFLLKNGITDFAGEAKIDDVIPTFYGLWSWQQSFSLEKGNVYTCDMRVRYTPFSATIKSSNISFVQLVKCTEIGTGKEAEFDGVKLARSTSSKWRVDRKVGMELGWYGYQDGSKGASDLITVGNSTKTPVVPAVLDDYPTWNVGNVKWEFQTFAIAKDGNGGKILSGLYWGFTVDKDFNMKRLSPTVVTNYQDFKESVAAWNTQVDFTGEKAKLKNSPNQQRFGDFVFSFTR